MRFTSTGVVAAAMVALGVTAFHTGIVGATPSRAATPGGTFQMYANVDQAGDLGSNMGAISAQKVADNFGLYVVTFSRPIGSCAAQAQSGYAGGNLQAGLYSSKVTDTGPNSFSVEFVDTTEHLGENSAFMLTVTCRS